MSDSGARTKVAPRLRPVVGSAVFVVVATVAQLLRQSGMAMWRTVWAEDGTVFYSEALHHTLIENIFRPVAGYGLALSRILAQVGTHLPTERYSLWITLSTTVIVSLLALFVYWASAPLLRAPFRQLVLAVAMVVLPVLPFEALGTISNLQWFLPLACLFAVLLPVDRPWDIAVRLPIVILGPLSSPFCLAFGPIVIVQLVMLYVRRRKAGSIGRRSLVVPVAYLLACLGQLSIYAGAKHEVSVAVSLSDKVRAIIRLYPTRVATDLVFGVHNTPGLWTSFGYGLAGVATVILGALVVSKLVRADTVARLWIVGLVGAGAALFVLSILVRTEYLTTLVMTRNDEYSFEASRYEIYPAFLLILALLLPLHQPAGLLVGPSPGYEPPPGQDSAGRSALDRLSGDLPWKGALMVVVAWFAIAVVPSMRLETARSPGPSWPTGVRAAQATCKLLAQPATETIGISPAPQWTVVMTCAELDAAGG